jgi:hypothetical protein
VLLARVRLTVLVASRGWSSRVVTDRASGSVVESGPRDGTSLGPWSAPVVVEALWRGSVEAAVIELVWAPSVPWLVVPSLACSPSQGVVPGACLGGGFGFSAGGGGRGPGSLGSAVPGCLGGGSFGALEMGAVRCSPDRTAREEQLGGGLAFWASPGMFCWEVIVQVPVVVPRNAALGARPRSGLAAAGARLAVMQEAASLPRPLAARTRSAARAQARARRLAPWLRRAHTRSGTFCTLKRWVNFLVSYLICI